MGYAYEGTPRLPRGMGITVHAPAVHCDSLRVPERMRAPAVPGGGPEALLTTGNNAEASFEPQEEPKEPEEEEESEALAASVDMVLEMTATSDADGFQRPPSVSRAEVARALRAADGDVSRAVDEVLSLAAIRVLRVEEQEARAEQLARQSRLQLHELCEGLGLGECTAFVRALEALPEHERDDVLSTNGGFIQQLLLAMDEEEELDDDQALDALGNQQQEQEEEHPLAQLIAMYPNYRVEVVEDVLEQQGYDVEAAALALHNLRALDHVQSFATVVSASGKTAAAQRDLLEHGPQVESLGQFPALSSRTQQKKLKRAQRQRTQQRNQQLHVVATAEAARRACRSNVQAAKVNHWDASHPREPGRTGRDAAAAAAIDANQMESGLASQLKIDRLHRLLPSVDRSLIQTTFFLNGGSSDATEASLREIFNVPLADQPKPNQRAQWSTVSHRRRVEDTRKELSDRYCDLLDSFRRDHRAMAADRVRNLSKARQDLRDAQRQLAHDFFVAHQEQIKCQQPLDLHGLIVMEALQVVRETVEYCQENRIRRCLFICGQGHHSVNGRPRILTAVRLSLERRLIDYRELHGIVTVFPLRSPNAS